MPAAEHDYVTNAIADLRVDLLNDQGRIRAFQRIQHRCREHAITKNQKEATPMPTATIAAFLLLTISNPSPAMKQRGSEETVQKWDD